MESLFRRSNRILFRLIRRNGIFSLTVVREYDGSKGAAWGCRHSKIRDYVSNDLLSPMPIQRFSCCKKPPARMAL
jgi:hypothetical protein